MIAGRYTRDREIGRGGMGAVWLGRDEVLGRPVAIKRVGILPGDAGPDVARAEREAKIAASLNHPHIVGIFDLVAEDGEQWMIMEYVEGTTLSGLVRDQGPLTPEQARPIIVQAASALAAAHASGIVHRDVKPSNILVRDDGQVKLTDFGIARGQTDAALTQTGLVTGSPAYLAPEVASGHQATSASDVWSLGATLFHALAGHPPYDASDNVLAALYRIVNEPPPRLEDAGALAPLLAATMVRSPEERWTMTDINRFLDTGIPQHRAPAAATRSAPEPARTSRHTQHVDQHPVTVLAPTPAPAAPQRRRWLLPTVVSVLVAALAATIVAIALRADPQDNLAQPGSGTSTTSSTPSKEPETTPAGPQKPTRRELRTFVDSYLDLASSDPQRGFQLLTPSFQQQSTRYEEFWGSVSNPQLLSFSADPDALTVSYTYRYQRQGFGQQVDPVQLQLVATDEGFLIDGPV
ncbi:MAG: serine/threonine-protein kinase [Nocardioides sp.]